MQRGEYPPLVKLPALRRLLAALLLALGLGTLATLPSVAQSGGKIFGYVTDRQGQPLARMNVYLHYTVPVPGGAGAVYEYTDTYVTNAQGYYATGSLAPNRYRLQFAGGREYDDQYYNQKSTFATSDPITITQAGEQLQINAVLGRYGSLTGRVTDAAGQPLAQVEVGLFRPDGMQLERGFSNAAGEYSFARLENRTYRVRYEHPHYVTEYYADATRFDRATDVTIPLDQVTTLAEVQLMRRGVITGVVTSSDGQPLAGVYVRPNYPARGSGGWSGDIDLDTVTDNQGRYTLYLPPQEYRLAFEHPAYVVEYYHDQVTIQTATSFSVTAGSVIPNIHATLLRPGEVVAAFQAAPTRGSVPLTVVITDTSVGPMTAWQWNFGDGATSTARHPTHVYATPGTYSVTLTVTGANNSDSETKSGYITVQPATVSDRIFADGFEGDLTAWSNRYTDGGDLSITPAAALVENKGLQATLDDNVLLSVVDERPNAEPRYRARFYLDPNSLTMAQGDMHTIFFGYSGSGLTRPVVQVELRFFNSSYQVRGGLLDDGTTWRNSGWLSLSDAPHFLELDWRAATAAGSNNGGLTLWLDGVQRSNLTGVDNDTRRIDRARLGPQAGLDNGTRGTYFFDAFESRQQSYIGPAAGVTSVMTATTPVDPAELEFFTDEVEVAPPDPGPFELPPSWELDAGELTQPLYLPLLMP